MREEFNCEHSDVCMYKHEIEKLDLKSLVDGVMEDALNFSVTCKFYKKVEAKPKLMGVVFKMKSENKVIKVSGSSPVKETAGSIVKCYLEDGVKDIELRAVGAGAVNQMYKSVATANSMFAQKGHSLTIRPGFADIEINSEKRTALIARLIIE